MDELRPPEIVAHADWSKDQAGRSIAVARRSGSEWLVAAPVPVRELSTLVDWLLAEAGDGGSAFLGVDFPIGLPAEYARSARISDFMTWLPRAGRGAWSEFFEPATLPSEISLHRPFYPLRNAAKGQILRDHLVRALGVAGFADIHRLCDRGQPNRAAAAALFWTLGGNQVGKAAISGWRDLLQPELRLTRRRIHVWPYEGALADLLARPGLTLAETYPGEIYAHLDLTIRERHKSKIKPTHRVDDADQLLGWAAANGVRLADSARQSIATGFRSDHDFDATVGLFGMINILRGNRPEGAPDNPLIRTVEGWILGQLAPGTAIEIGRPRP